MKFAFLKKLNSKAIAVITIASVVVLGGGTAIAFAATAPKTEAPELSEQEAKAAIFSHAGVTEDDVLSLQIDKGSENGIQVYEVEFKTADKSYDYDIVRSSGEILHSSYDVLGSQNVQEKPDTAVTSSQKETSSAPTAESPAATPNTSSTAPETSKTPASQEQAVSKPSSNQGKTNSASSAVTKEQAKSIALKDAGVSESDTQFVWVKEDYDDGRAVYDVEFYANGVEYDYEIERSTGRIISSDRDIEHYTPSTGGNSGTIISLDEARSIALKKVPGAAASDVRIHLDRDDGRQVYEGEIYYNQMEYEFEIDASTGTVIEWSAERWDD